MKFQAKPGCEFCDKYGLPVLVVRYATAPETAAAPKTKALDLDGKDFGDIGGKLHYTRRLLRSGYLYVYDEARNRWEGYYITPDAHLMKFEVNKPLPTAYASNPQPCEDSGHREVAGMVTIRDPKNATNVWFGFSDVEWTEKVLNEHASAEYRKKHMQKVDVKQALAKAKQPNVHPIKELDKKVAEFACDPLRATAVNAFYDSPFKFNPRKLQLKESLAAADSLRKDGGVIVSLHDPVAVATELAGWMNLRLENYLEANKKDPDYARKIAVSSAILQLRNVVKDHAEHSLIDDAEQSEFLERIFTTVSPSRDNLEENFQKTGKPSLQAVQKAQASAWQRYTHRQNGHQTRFDETVVEDFHKDYNAKLNAFIEADINPLGASHVAWTSSQHMAYSMACNFDPTDIRSGVAYTQTVITFIRGTEGVKPCFAHYEKWLDQNEFKPENVLLRALVYNNDKLAKDVEEATKFDPRALPWDAPISTYKAAMEKMGGGHADRAAVLMGHMMGPLMKVGERFLDGSSKAVITLLGVYSGKGWRRLHFQGKRKELRAFLARQIIESSGNTMTDSQVKKAVAREIKRAQIRGEKLQGQRGMKWVVLLEPATGQMRTPQTLEEIRFNNFKKTIATNVRLGICTGILQAICLTKAIADEGKALEADKAEAQWRLFAGGLAVAGTIGEAIGTVVENATQANLRWVQGLKVVKAGAVLRTGGRAFGIIGAAIMATWDLLKGWEELRKKDFLTAGLYFGSALFGVATAIALTFFTFNPFTLLLVVAFIGIAYWLETTKDNAIQSWIENCIFGINNTYKEGSLEMKELAKALS
ncbi:hypothetical protein EDC30_11769 [Paucimonas lemoignei]|uniref:Toxin VasX N-terminal region domain-containing protein n=1 Tax=Paucimonas lemoignei TaxID=29443 RepID=A0A4V2UI59_PAULE|nr:T6SS effector BTH_I2691 family protein [Paucimonas lemoignei]TCS33314.1 hypothetical protein EDC30_11769 [Paucimonas lemoignei]